LQRRKTFSPWISTVKRGELSFEGDPVEAIEGLLSDINMDSVELQHEAKKAWMRKGLRNVLG